MAPSFLRTLVLTHVLIGWRLHPSKSLKGSEMLNSQVLMCLELPAWCLCTHANTWLDLGFRSHSFPPRIFQTLPRSLPTLCLRGSGRLTWFPPFYVTCFSGLMPKEFFPHSCSNNLTQDASMLNNLHEFVLKKKKEVILFGTSNSLCMSGIFFLIRSNPQKTPWDGARGCFHNII